ncbi:ChbG/HpnK family deacetylase [Comamonas sp. Y33R10-2]|uniref:ChbG/HpnK family deacetylase n=1 Tax=Comamonas sp. Y33R10-2 TaxID=2853257 RepID=UPI001C5C93E1|nr:ChbG/HpnK family deacetylase [Comamonas sp. Y33R10-2]QXZ09006.1 ChbG/HpnK family deacetylase [Comamonas sp. Y33R10-2]
MSYTASTSRSIMLCADDYALHPLVDDAVQQLARAGRLSATSCMSTSPHWLQAAPALKPLRPLLSVGLHFNLTEGHGGQHAAQALGQVIRQAYSHQISAAQMRTAWREQLDAFEQAMGTPPDFIDGHQHVHQLPGLRTAMLKEMQSRYSAHERPWVRSTAPAAGLWRSPKAAIIALLGGWAATRQLRKAAIPMNKGFGGVYGFDAPDAATYGAQMAGWLPHMANGGLLMCHPASGIVKGDAIAQQRPVEFEYLMSDAFGALLERNHCRIHQGPVKNF